MGVKILRTLQAAVVAVSLAITASAAIARGGGHGGGRHDGGSHSYGSSHTGNSSDFKSGSHAGSSYQGGSYSFHRGNTPGVERDARGRIARSAKAKDAFKRLHPCPSTGRSYGACRGTSSITFSRSSAAAPIPRRTCSGRPRRKRRPRTESSDAHPVGRLRRTRQRRHRSSNALRHLAGHWADQYITWR